MTPTVAAQGANAAALAEQTRQRMAAAKQAAAALVFLGGPPDPAPSSYVGRIRLYRLDPTDAWSRGDLILPGGTSISWIAYSDGVARHLALFQSPGRVVVTGHHLSGDLYLTGIRPAPTP